MKDLKYIVISSGRQVKKCFTAISETFKRRL